MVVVGLALVAGACGSGSGGASGDLPLLPGSGGGGAGGVAAGLSTSGGAAGVAEDRAVAQSAELCEVPERSEPVPCDDPPGSTPIEYRLADDIDEMGGEGAAYRLDGEADEDALNRLAAALGHEGPVKEEYGTFTMGELAAGGAYLSLGPDGSFNFYDESAHAADTSVSAVCTPEGECTEKAPGGDPPPPADLPTEAEAETAASELLRDAGIDLDGYRAAVETSAYSVAVVYSLEIDGVPVEGWVQAVVFGDEGIIQNANGSIATTSKIGDYPLLETTRAYDRWMSGFGGPRVGIDMGRPEPLPLPVEPDSGIGDGAGAPGSASGDEPVMTIEPTPGPGDEAPPASSEPEVVEIDGVERVLIVEYPTCPGDGLFLVPAYRLTVDGEPHLVVPAVTDEHLASAQSVDVGDANEGDTAIENCPTIAGQSVPGREPDAPPVTEVDVDITG